MTKGEVIYFFIMFAVSMFGLGYTTACLIAFGVDSFGLCTAIILGINAAWDGFCLYSGGKYGKGF